MAAGISASTLDRTLTLTKPLEAVLQQDQRQPETTISIRRYLSGVVSRRRVGEGRRRLAQHRALLARVAARYPVQPRFIVALWAIESDFGAVTGRFSVIDALTTLAFSSARQALFRAELLDALRVLDRSGWPTERLRGSWAGAMGQTQFMPSSYLRYGTAFDHDGLPDIWGDEGDVFASIARYLSSEGWRADQSWGRRVRLPSRFDPSLIGGKTIMPLRDWAAAGVRDAGGRHLPEADIAAGLVNPGGADGPMLLVYDNYRVILKWNHSTYFATAVSFLADQLQV